MKKLLFSLLFSVVLCRGMDKAVSMADVNGQALAVLNRIHANITRDNADLCKQYNAFNHWAKKYYDTDLSWLSYDVYLNLQKITGKMEALCGLGKTEWKEIKPESVAKDQIYYTNLENVFPRKRTLVKQWIVNEASKITGQVENREEVAIEEPCYADPKAPAPVVPQAPAAAPVLAAPKQVSFDDEKVLNRVLTIVQANKYYVAGGSAIIAVATYLGWQKYKQQKETAPAEAK